MEKIIPIISVIVPVFNVENYLARCVESVLGQTFEDFQLILVNDGSTDDSLRICRRYESMDSRVTVINQQNGGSSSARNAGLNVAQGEWILHIDSDDWIEKDMLQILYNNGHKYKADIVACGLYSDDAVSYKKTRLYPYENIEPHSEIYRVDMQYSAVWNKLVRKELYDKYNIRFVEGVRMWEDLAVTSRLRFHSAKTVIVNKPLYHYFCAPRASITRQDAGNYPESQIKVMEFLSRYFKSVSSDDKMVRKIITSLKLTAKKNLFSFKTESRYNQWKSLYEEENHRILGMKHLPLKQRILMYVASILSYKQMMLLYTPYKLLFDRSH